MPKEVGPAPTEQPLPLKDEKQFISSSSSSSESALPPEHIIEPETKPILLEESKKSGRPSLADVFAVGGLDISEPSPPAKVPESSSSEEPSSSRSSSGSEESEGSEDSTSELTKLACDASLSTESGDGSYSESRNSTNQSSSDSESESKSESASGSSSVCLFSYCLICFRMRV